jgi:hypothetical protein
VTAAERYTRAVAASDEARKAVDLALQARREADAAWLEAMLAESTAVDELAAARAAQHSGETLS